MRQKVRNWDEPIAEIIRPQKQRLEACTELLFTRPQDCALFLDVDGTLVDLAATPQSITVPDGLVEILGGLAAGLQGALAIITGRRVNEMDRILAPLSLPASGVHGAELRLVPNGPVEQLMPAIPAEMIQALAVLVARTPGAFIEPKGPGLAIHYRLAPHAGPVMSKSLRRFLKLYPGRFKIYPGQKVLEIIPTGYSKGRGLATFAVTHPFTGRIPIMIGDDTGDEPAFAMAEQLNGYGLRVAGENFGSHEVDFSGSAAVRAWLEHLANRLA